MCNKKRNYKFNVISGGVASLGECLVQLQIKMIITNIKHTSCKQITFYGNIFFFFCYKNPINFFLNISINN